VKRMLAALACRLGAAALARRRGRRRLVVLMYHGVVERALEPFCWHQLPLGHFRAQIAWVARRFTVLPLDEALTRLAAGTLPEHACALTFDDGYRNLTLAEPVLAALGLPATVFLPTGAVGRGELLWPDRAWLALAADGADDARVARTLDALKALPRVEKDAALAGIEARAGAIDATSAAPFALLDWEEARAMLGRGVFSFGPHSTAHEILSRCDDAEVRAQVSGSVLAIREHLGLDAQVFAYPNGRAQDFDARTRAAVTAAGVRWALSTEDGRNGPRADPLALRRTSIGADLDFATFVLLASGWTDRPED